MAKQKEEENEGYGIIYITEANLYIPMTFEAKVFHSSTNNQIT